MKVFDVKWTSVTAGPSPNGNKRSEIFLMGCKDAMDGKPCKGCFNPMIWETKKDARDYSSEEAAERILKFSPNKYITFVGGEPLDQMDDLADTCSILKKNGFHIIVFTHFLLFDIIYDIKKKAMKLLENIDILIDGLYIQEERIYDDNARDGFHDAIGSGNQVIWDLHGWNVTGYDFVFGFQARDLNGFLVTNQSSTVFLTKKSSYRGKSLHLTHTRERKNVI